MTDEEPGPSGFLKIVQYVYIQVYLQWNVQ